MDELDTLCVPSPSRLGLVGFQEGCGAFHRPGSCYAAGEEFVMQRADSPADVEEAGAGRQVITQALEE
jgi:hypothetical protein